MSRPSTPTRDARITSLAAAALQLADDVQRQPTVFNFSKTYTLDAKLNAGNALGFVLQRAGISEIVGTRPAKDPKRALAEALSVEVGDLPVKLRRAAAALARPPAEAGEAIDALKDFAEQVATADINTHRRGRTPMPYVAGQRRLQREVQTIA